MRHGIQGGRSFFLPPNGHREYLGDFYELWLGLFQSLCLGEMPLLNVDVNHKAFPRRYDSLIMLFKDMERDMRLRIDLNRPLEQNVLIALQNHLTGLEICYNGAIIRRIYKFRSIEQIPENCPFTTHHDGQTNVLEYFQNSGRIIQYPALPCIQIGNNINNQIVPMEYCSIADTQVCIQNEMCNHIRMNKFQHYLTNEFFSFQVINKKCTTNQTKNIIDHAATNTNTRKDKIMNLIEQINHNGSQTIGGFGLNVDAKFVKVPARQLDAPSIEYANFKMVQPFKGAWNMEDRKNQIENCFLMAETNAKWGILNTNVGQRQRFPTTSYELNKLTKMVRFVGILNLI